MAEKGCTALVLSALDEVAWLFNMRGSDIAYNPVFFAYAVVLVDRAVLYTDAVKLAGVGLPYGVEVRAYEQIYADLPGFAKDGKMWLDSRSNYALLSAVPANGPGVEDGKNPVLLAKAVKNEVEVEGFRNCHLRDAAALVGTMSVSVSSFVF
jgi:Xaa-Pro aminopeptidase